MIQLHYADAADGADYASAIIFASCHTLLPLADDADDVDVYADADAATLIRQLRHAAMILPMPMPLILRYLR